MTKFNLIIALVFTTIFFKAQNTKGSKIKSEVILGSELYNNLKADGRLAHYEIINTPGKNQTITQTIYSPAGITTSTLTPCDAVTPGTVLPFPLPLDDETYFNATGGYINLPFTFCFYGTNYTQVNFSSNGNIQLPPTNNASFSSVGFPAPIDKMIAPFWADIDNRGIGQYYLDIHPTYAVFTWTNVGYYASHTDKTNSFQLVITNGLDPILPPGKNVGFYYDKMEWTTGDASSGVNGFPNPLSPPAIPATVGINAGNGIDFFLIGRFGVPGVVYDGPGGANDGVAWLSGKHFYFNACPALGANIEPVTTSGYCDTLTICAIGDTLVYTTTFLAPEITQTVSVTGSSPTLGGSFVPLGSTFSAGGTTTFAWMVIATPTVSGIHQVFITGTDNGMPPLSSTITYFIKIKNVAIAQPTVVSSPAGTVCAPPGATLTLINCAAYDNVFWSNGTFGCSMIANVSGIYYCTVQKTGCFKSSKDSIVVFPNPTPVVFGPKNYCIPATSTTLSLDPPLPGMAAYTSYTWTAGGINTPTASLTGSLGGTSYTIGVTDANGCIGKSTFSISTQTPTLGITANPLTLCGTGSSTLTASISGATSYLWSNGATTQTASINISGVHSVTVVSNFCITTQTLNITINPTPTVTIPPIASMCSGSNATVAATSFSPAGVYTYTWSNGSNSPSQTISTNTILTLFVTNTVTGCKSAISNSCTVLASTNPTVSLSSTPIIFCNGLNATLTPTVTGGTPAYTYTWSPALLGSASTATTNIVGTFTVLVVDQNLCMGTKTVTTVKSSPTAMLSSSDLTICPTECAKIKAVGTSSYSPFTYAWSSSPSIGDSTFACASGVVSFTFTDAQGCESIQTITVVDDIIPVASFTASPPSPVVPGQLITFVNTSSISSGSINPGFWMFGDGGSATGDVVNYAYTGSGTFPVTLYVTSSTGCTDTVMINYVVDALISAPNIITPNGDNVNDFLKFKNLEFFTSNNLTILNRWGTKLLEKENYKNDWNGAGAVDGTYFYILSIPGATPNIYKGFFEVIH